MKECRLCKTANEDSIAFCRVCGTKFPESNNQEEIIPEAINLSNELKEIKALLQTIAAPQNAKECTILVSTPFSSSQNEEMTKMINTHLSQGWIIAGFAYGDHCLRALMTR